MRLMCVFAAAGLSACATTGLSAAPTDAQMERTLRELQRSHGSLVQTSTLGQSRDGRPLHLIRLGAENRRGTPGPDDRPALLIVAGVSGDHLVGTDVALGLAERLVADHADMLAERTVYIVPRLNPDAAAVHLAGGPKRSFNHTTTPDDADGDGRTDEDGPADLNGDGVITMMRVKNPPAWLGASLVVDSDEPRLMRAPKPEAGEAAEYALLVESRDADGDGVFGEDGAGGVDLDRNFMHQWPEHKPYAGLYPLSEAESRSLVRWMLDRPNIAAVLVFGPHDSLAKIPEAGKMDITGRAPVGIETGDKAYYEKIAEVFKEITKINAASSADQAGSFHSWAYAQYAVPAFSTPVWVRPDQIKKDGDEAKPASAAPAARPAGAGGLSEADIQAMVAEFQSATPDQRRELMARVQSMSPEDRQRVMAAATGQAGGGARPGGAAARAGAGAGAAPARNANADKEDIAWLKYSDEERDGAGFIPWTPFEHPQLGSVEIGGFVPGFRMNPPDSELPRLIDEQSRFAADLLGRLPMVRLAEPTVERIGDGLWRVSLEAVNEGYFPTALAIAQKARRQPGTAMVADIDAGAVVAGDILQIARNIPGSGGRARAEWLIAQPEGARFDIIVRSPQLGERRVPVRLGR